MCVSKTKSSKAVVTQDNRFVYAKYDLNANEMKFFMWIIAQINSQKDQLFPTCLIPLSEVFEIWQWKKGIINYSYCADIVANMSRKVYIEDFKLLDEKTMKTSKVRRAMPLFEFIEYRENDSYITYKLNDSLMKYLTKITTNFTQVKIQDIQKMKSAYSIRIYNMLSSEIGQNRTVFKINLAVLQNILGVPDSFREWFDFKRNVLQRAVKDINEKSNLVILDITTKKTGRKITDLEISFDYKNNKDRIERGEKKVKNFISALIKVINDKFLGKSLKSKQYGVYVCEGAYFDETLDKVCMDCCLESGERIKFTLENDFSMISILEKYRQNAENDFWLNEFIKSDKSGIFDHEKLFSLFKKYEK